MALVRMLGERWRRILVLGRDLARAIGVAHVVASVAMEELEVSPISDETWSHALRRWPVLSIRSDLLAIFFQTFAGTSCSRNLHGAIPGKRVPVVLQVSAE